MPTRVTLPDGRIVNFPDGMAPADIETEVSKLIGAQESTTPPPRDGMGTRFVRGVGSGVYDSSLGTINSLVTEPVETVSGALRMMGLMGLPAQAEALKGLADNYAERFREDPIEAAGNLVGTAGTAYLTGRVAPPLGRAVKRAPAAAARTGQAIVRGADAMEQATPLTRAALGGVFGDATGAAVGVAGPPTLRVLGRVLERGGRALTPTPKTPPQGPIAPITAPPSRVVPSISSSTAGRATRPTAARGTAATWEQAVPGRTPVDPVPDAPVADVPRTVEPWDPTPIQQAERAWRRGLAERLKASDAQRVDSPVETPPVVEAPPVDPAVSLRDALAQAASKYRQELGSRDAARSLGMTKDQFKKLAPGASQLPERARRAIDNRLKTLTPAQRQLYLEMAPNQFARDYIASKLNEF